MVTVVALALGLGLAACGDGGTQPGDLRYGQLGSISVEVDAPLRNPVVGRVRQTLIWQSNGAWTLREAISYKGMVGDENLMKSQGDPARFAGFYATLIAQLNESVGLQIYNFPDPELSPDSIPECGETRTRISFSIRDEPRNDTTTWVRCAEGSMATLTTASAGPGATAARIAQAAINARDYTVGETFAGTYSGSVPFATLDRGENLSSSERASTTFTDSASFRSFWGQAAGARPLPNIDFNTEMVILGVAGVSTEAGDSVEVRKVLQVDKGTLIEVWERVPGDFCSPAARTHVPYHLVVAPLMPVPLNFSDIQVQRVPCGG